MRTIPTLNGKRFDDPPTEKPYVNTVEIWNLINLTPDTHPIHLHLVQFRLLQRRPFNVSLYQTMGDIVYTGPPMYCPSLRCRGPRTKIGSCLWSRPLVPLLQTSWGGRIPFGPTLTKSPPLLCPLR